MRLGLRARIISWFFIPTVILLVAVGLFTFYAGQGTQVRVVCVGGFCGRMGQNHRLQFTGFLCDFGHSLAG
jgi:hypothetical protein